MCMNLEYLESMCTNLENCDTLTILCSRYCEYSVIRKKERGSVHKFGTRNSNVHKNGKCSCCPQKVESDEKRDCGQFYSHCEKNIIDMLARKSAVNDAFLCIGIALCVENSAIHVFVFRLRLANRWRCRRWIFSPRKEEGDGFRPKPQSLFQCTQFDSVLVLLPFCYSP